MPKSPGASGNARPDGATKRATAVALPMRSVPVAIGRGNVGFDEGGRAFPLRRGCGTVSNQRRWITSVWAFLWYNQQNRGPVMQHECPGLIFAGSPASIRPETKGTARQRGDSTPNTDAIGARLIVRPRRQVSTIPQ